MFFNWVSKESTLDRRTVIAPSASFNCLCSPLYAFLKALSLCSQERILLFVDPYNSYCVKRLFSYADQVSFSHGSSLGLRRNVMSLDLGIWADILETWRVLELFPAVMNSRCLGGLFCLLIGKIRPSSVGFVGALIGFRLD